MRFLSIEILVLSGLIVSGYLHAQTRSAAGACPQVFSSNEQLRQAIADNEEAVRDLRAQLRQASDAWAAIRGAPAGVRVNINDDLAGVSGANQSRNETIHRLQSGLQRALRDGATLRNCRVSAQTARARPIEEPSPGYQQIPGALLNSCMQEWNHLLENNRSEYHVRGLEVAIPLNQVNLPAGATGACLSGGRTVPCALPFQLSQERTLLTGIQPVNLRAAGCQLIARPERVGQRRTIVSMGGVRRFQVTRSAVTGGGYALEPRFQVALETRSLARSREMQSVPSQLNRQELTRQLLERQRAAALRGEITDGLRDSIIASSGETFYRLAQTQSEPTYDRRVWWDYSIDPYTNRGRLREQLRGIRFKFLIDSLYAANDFVTRIFTRESFSPGQGQAFLPILVNDHGDEFTGESRPLNAHEVIAIRNWIINNYFDAVNLTSTSIDANIGGVFGPEAVRISDEAYLRTILNSIDPHPSYTVLYFDNDPDFVSMVCNREVQNSVAIDVAGIRQGNANGIQNRCFTWNDLNTMGLRSYISIEDRRETPGATQGAATGARRAE